MVIFPHFLSLELWSLFCIMLFLEDMKGRKNGLLWMRPERLFSSEYWCQNYWVAFAKSSSWVLCRIHRTEQTTHFLNVSLMLLNKMWACYEDLLQNIGQSELVNTIASGLSFFFSWYNLFKIGQIPHIAEFMLVNSVSSLSWPSVLSHIALFWKGEIPRWVRSRFHCCEDDKHRQAFLIRFSAKNLGNVFSTVEHSQS